jgi:thiol:disulfide interchange protein DsbD
MNRIALAVLVAVGLACSEAPRVVSAQPADPVHWSLVVTSKGPVMPGKPFEASLTARIDKGWHLYSLDEPVGGPPPLVITLGKGVYTLASGIVSPTPESKIDANWENKETYFFLNRATFLLPLRVDAKTPLGKHRLEVTTTYVTCSDALCYPPKDTVVALDIELGATTPAPGSSGPTGSTTGSTGSADSSPATVPVADAAAAAGTAPSTAGPTLGLNTVVDMAASSKASTLGAYIGLAALMGALSLITPCVFPMVPITVSYFTNRAKKKRSEAVLQALIYGLGIVLTFTAVGFTLAIGFGASGLNRFAADPWLNIAVTAMFVAFALSLFGVWELALPSKLVNAASRADSGKGRLAGTLLMGLAFTLTSFTCTAPFLGTLLVVASQGDWQWPLAGMLAFSSVFALPFVILAFVPQVLANLPRSGPWLIAVKAVMGIVELAAAMKFLSNVDLVWGWNIFTRDVVLATWVLLTIVLVVYLAGFVKLGPVPRLKRPGPVRLLMVGAAIALGIWLGTGLAGRRLGELEAFLPPADLAKMSGGELHWIENWEEGLALAKKENRRIMVDFTGVTCTNCRWMEANMFPRQDVSRELARYVRVRLYTDRPTTDDRRYQKMEETLFGTVALPYYAVMSPEGKPVVTFGGLTRNPDEYLNFLRAGLQ